MDRVRLNLILPRGLLHEIEIMAGSRERSQFIVEAIRDRLAALQKRKLQELMAEGYKATGAEDKELVDEFTAIDLENWDDY
jgi:metal-responsive CopG/Arc/MetJ family transcriptional regulator